MTCGSDLQSREQEVPKMPLTSLNIAFLFILTNRKIFFLNYLGA